MPCMKMIYENKNAGTLVCIQEQRTVLVPRINHGQTSCQQLVVFPHRFAWDSFFVVFRASGESLRTVIFHGLGGKRGGYLLGEPTRRRPILPRPALPRRPAVRCAAPTSFPRVEALCQDTTQFKKRPNSGANDSPVCSSRKGRVDSRAPFGSPM